MSVPRIAALLELDPDVVAAVPAPPTVDASLIARSTPVRVDVLRRPRSPREQQTLERNRRGRAIRAAKRAARALWARCAAPLDDVGCTATIAPPADELLDLVFEPEPPPCPVPTRWEQTVDERTRWGESNGQAKLTRETAREVRRLHADGLSCYELARRYGVSRGTIAAIVKGRTWLELDGVDDQVEEPPPAAIAADQIDKTKAKRHRWRSVPGTPKFGARGSGSLHDDD
jgi:DNA-binding CsgD family transcriptional regulator